MKENTSACLKIRLQLNYLTRNINFSCKPVCVCSFAFGFYIFFFQKSYLVFGQWRGIGACFFCLFFRREDERRERVLVLLNLNVL